MLLWLLACAEPETTPVVVSPDDPARVSLRMDALPRVWPNRLPTTGDVELAAIGSDAVSPLDLDSPALVAWDRSVEVPLDLPIARDVDGDGLPDAVWTVPAATLATLIGPLSGRVVLEGWLGERPASGWDIVVQPEAPVVALPSPTGPHPVGTALASSDAGRRADPLTDSGRLRTLPLQVWYPAEVAPFAQPCATYLNYAEAQAAAAFLALPSPDHFDRVLGAAVLGVPAVWRPPAEAWPVVLLTPGDGPLAMHTALATEIASHGYIVIGVNPPFSGIPVVLADGTDATAPEREDPVSFDEVVEVWAADATQLLLTAADWQEGDPRLEELLALDRVAHLGVALGGAASIAACQANAALVACIDWDGAPRTGAAPTPQSLLVVTTGTRQVDEPQFAAALAATLSPSWSVALPEGGPDALWDIGQYGELAPRPLRTGVAPAEESFATAAALTLDFLDLTLRGGPGSQLAAQAEPWGGATPAPGAAP